MFIEINPSAKTLVRVNDSEFPTPGLRNTSSFVSETGRWEVICLLEGCKIDWSAQPEEAADGNEID